MFEHAAAATANVVDLYPFFFSSFCCFVWICLCGANIRGEVFNGLNVNNTVASTKQTD